MTDKTVSVEAIEHVINLFGSFDMNARIIEKEFGVTLINRGGEILIKGEDSGAELAKKAIEALLVIAKKGSAISEQEVRYVISLVETGSENRVGELTNDLVCITAKGSPLKPKTIAQKQYVDSIEKNTVTICIGPAGTGKTFLAVAKAVTALKKKQVSRIVLTRPAVEAGEKLGFLPGDLQRKVDPYLRPLYDALFEMLGADTVAHHIEKGIIEVVPLAYMRGRTLDESFIILDEAQNTTPQQMKMFLTRLGFNSKAVITGDITQIDLDRGVRSGLKEIVKILKGIDDIAICTLSNRDVVRHKLVMEIIRAYEKYEANQQENDPGKKRYPEAEHRRY